MKRRVAFILAFAATFVPWIVLFAMAALRSLVFAAPFVATLREVSVDLLTLALAQALACGIIIFAGLFREAPASHRQALLVRPVPMLSLLVATLAGLAMHFLLAEIANAVEIFVPRALETKLRLARILTPTDFASGSALVFAVILVAPVCEELIFRGLMLPRLALYVGSREAILLTALLFGASHAAGGLHSVIPATLAGLALAYVARATRSVLPAIAMHAGSNALPLLLPVGLARVPGLNVVREGPSHIHPVLVLTSLAVTLAALLYLARDANDGRDDRE
jgi:membrane protease YdiL (CAAX protease family)